MTEIINIKHFQDTQLPANYVYIGRPSKWGNPFEIGKHGSREEVVKKFEAWLKSKPKLIAEAKIALKGKVLGCWCKPYACHGDVWLRYLGGEKIKYE